MIDHKIEKKGVQLREEKGIFFLALYLDILANFRFSWTVLSIIAQCML